MCKKDNGKFDYKKYCNKNRKCHKDKKEEKAGFASLKFVPFGYGMQMAKIHLDNGFDLVVTLNKNLLIDDIEIEYDYRNTGKRLSVYQIFPELVKNNQELLQTSEIVEKALRLASQIPGDNQEKFLDEIHDRM